VGILIKEGERIMDEQHVRELVFLVKTYDGFTRFGASAQNRFQSLIGKEGMKYDDVIKEAGSIKGKMLRRIEKTLALWPLWTDYLAAVPGIGPAIAGRLIILFKYRFQAICPDCAGDVEKKEGALVCLGCGKVLKGDGNLKYRIDERDFPTISKWWAFMGRHNVDGKMPKRKAGVVSNWSTPGRTLGKLIGDSFIKQGSENLYRRFYDERKVKAQKDHPDASKLHIHNMAENEMIKLFLAHAWSAFRELEGKIVTPPYAGVIMGHTNLVAPFYFEATSEMKPTGAVRAIPILKPTPSMRHYTLEEART